MKVAETACRVDAMRNVYAQLRSSDRLGLGRTDFFNSLAIPFFAPRVESLAWYHPAYRSLLLEGVLPSSVLEDAIRVVPDSAYPTGCAVAEQVVERIVACAFWDDILYASTRMRLRLLNRSQVGSPRQKNFGTLVVQSSSDGEGRTLHTLPFYPRNYVPASDYRMSAMPPALTRLCGAVYRVLEQVLPPESLAFGPFNAVQVRGYYEAFSPHVGAHTDNGKLGTDGTIDSGAQYTQEPGTVVAVVMWGDCEMDMEFVPLPLWERSRPPVRFPLPGGGALLMLHPHDDCRCKHSLTLASSVLNPARVRIAYVLRQLRWTRQYDAESSKLVLTDEERVRLSKKRRRKQY